VKEKKHTRLREYFDGDVGDSWVVLKGRFAGIGSMGSVCRAWEGAVIASNTDKGCGEHDRTIGAMARFGLEIWATKVPEEIGTFSGIEEWGSGGVQMGWSCDDSDSVATAGNVCDDGADGGTVTGSPNARSSLLIRRRLWSGLATVIILTFSWTSVGCGTAVVPNAALQKK
jgi:hypothetical protein